MVTVPMLLNLVDTLHEKRRLLYVVAFISIDLLLLTFCSQTLQTHRPNIVSHINNSESSLRETYQQDALVGASMSDTIGHVATVVEVHTLRAAVTVIDGVAKADRGVQHATKTTLNALHTAALATGRTIGRTVAFMGRVIAFPFVAIGNGVGHVFGATSGLVNTQVASVIQPQKDIETPVITAEQAAQVKLIQKDTVAVTPIKPTGAGGACDSGAGNGGYPMEWCDARMDTIRTVAYSSDRINRQCTSYAYWYFTSILGHTDFHVSGNANRWARTSNYPTHPTPAVGAIAVQTSGVYGHVAIVQALPGQTYESQVVPEGYILVSEMNYDWQGHFRYSYSPLSKFSSYIYP